MEGTEPVAPSYDLLLKGGRVVDPERGQPFAADVAVVDGRIAAVGPNLPVAGAAGVLDVGGKLVTPGLIDLHAHGYWGVGYDGLRVDAVAGRTGVTTWVDAGSAGAATFPGFRRYVVEPSRTRIVPFLNLCAVGIIYRGVQEFENLRFADVSFAVEMIEEHRDLIAGIKLRLGRGIVGDNDDHPIWLAREVADLTGLPIMVHVGEPPPTLRRLLEALGPGDIVTHCFRGSQWGTGSILARGALRPEVRAARERGVRFDVGHGAGGFNVDVARRALDAGFLPDTISSDLHQASILGAARDLPHVLSKFLALGMPVEEVLRRATLVPAQTIRRDPSAGDGDATAGRDGIGTLRPGTPADLAVFDLAEGAFTFADTLGRPFSGTRQLRAVHTLRAGQTPAQQTPAQQAPEYGALPIFTRSRH